MFKRIPENTRKENHTHEKKYIKEAKKSLKRHCGVKRRSCYSSNRGRSDVYIGRDYYESNDRPTESKRIKAENHKVLQHRHTD